MNLIYLLLFSLFVESQEIVKRTFTLDEKIAAIRIHSPNQTLSDVKGLSLDLAKLRIYKLKSDYSQCASMVNRLKKSAKLMRPWLIIEELDCLILSRIQSSKSVASELDNLIVLLQDIEKNPEWFNDKSFGKRLKEKYIEASLKNLQSIMKFRRARTWTSIDYLSSLSDSMSKDQLADFYQMLGELYLVQQDSAAAIHFYERSLQAKERKDLRDKLNRISKAKEVVKTPLPGEMGVSRQESELFQKYKDALSAKDYLATVEEATKFIIQFPGSIRSKEVADQVIEIYLAVASSTDKKLKLAKDRILQSMQTVDFERIAKWVQLMMSREYFADALFLAQKAIDKMSGAYVATELVSLAAQSAYQIGEFSTARDFYQKLEKFHSGSVRAKEAIYRLGILHFRMEEYAESAAYFEKFLVFNDANDLEISSRYWLWRARQKLGIDGANQVALELIQKFPLSYYALRANLEMNKTAFTLPDTKDDKKITLTVWWSAREALAWDRFKILVGAGWTDEAQDELNSLPEPTDLEGKIVWAKFAALALDYHRALEIIISVWESSAGYRTAKVFQLIFPNEYSEFVNTQSKKNKISKSLLYSLIRQESTFRLNAVSGAGARGLMQVLPNTGRELAKDLKIQNFDPDTSLFNPEINIQIGSYYLTRLIKNFSGQVPLALAAYNAGIGNIKGWLRNRPDLANITIDQSAEYQNELWFEELPWTETTGYIKNILRNIIVYTLLDQSESEIKFPVWAN